MMAAMMQKRQQWNQLQPLLSARCSLLASLMEAPQQRPVSRRAKFRLIGLDAVGPSKSASQLHARTLGRQLK